MVLQPPTGVKLERTLPKIASITCPTPVKQRLHSGVAPVSTANSGCAAAAVLQAMASDAWSGRRRGGFVDDLQTPDSLLLDGTKFLAGSGGRYWTRTAFNVK
jgi:hypothetical protein